LREDLENYKKIAEESNQLATYYSPFTPLQKFKQEKLINSRKIKDEIIDLEDAVKDSKNIERLFKEKLDIEKKNAELLARI